MMAHIRASYARIKKEVKSELLCKKIRRNYRPVHVKLLNRTQQTFKLPNFFFHIVIDLIKKIEHQMLYGRKINCAYHNNENTLNSPIARLFRSLSSLLALIQSAHFRRIVLYTSTCQYPSRRHATRYVCTHVCLHVKCIRIITSSSSPLPRASLPSYGNAMRG